MGKPSLKWRLYKTAWRIDQRDREMMAEGAFRLILFEFVVVLPAYAAIAAMLFIINLAEKMGVCKE